MQEKYVLIFWIHFVKFVEGVYTVLKFCSFFVKLKVALLHSFVIMNDVYFFRTKYVILY